MNEARFQQGRSVRIVTLPGAEPWIAAQRRPHAGKTGTVIDVWCRTRDEMPELSKSFVYPDVWCCDVRLDDGTVVRGVPEEALDSVFPA